VSRRVVIDASVLLHLVLDRSSKAVAVIHNNELTAPALIVPETTNGLATQIRFRALDPGRAAALMAECLALPIQLVPDTALSVDALSAAAQLQLSAYDAEYVILAGQLGVTLVTADQRLAASYPHAELIV
jgi:predicted nucleic acid-binding protein